MPTPVKPTIHPEKFSKRYRTPDAPVHNPDLCGVCRGTCVRRRVWYTIHHSLLFEAARQETQYLSTDTHWKPEAMKRVANRLAAFIKEQVELSSGQSRIYTKITDAIANIGDIAKMLKLPENQILFPSERVTRRCYTDPFR